METNDDTLFTPERALADLVDLDALATAEQAALAQPWIVGTRGDTLVTPTSHDADAMTDEERWYGGTLVAESMEPSTVRFVAAAREAIPLLIAEARRWRKREAALRARLPVWRTLAACRDGRDILACVAEVEGILRDDPLFLNEGPE